MHKKPLKAFNSIRFFSFVQQIHYFSQQPNIGCCHPVQHEHKEKQTIIKKTVFALIENSNEVIRVDLQVPPIPPTDFATNNIVNVTYHLRVCNKFYIHDLLVLI